MKDTINVAVIGAGYWGKKVMQEYLQLSKTDPRVQLAMICDLADQNLEYCRDVLGVRKEILAKDYHQALDSGKIDAVHICTPNDTHYEISRQALAVNKHTLLEKPMALTAKDSWKLVADADHKHLILQVGHIFRFNNALRAMRDLLTQNYLGQLYYLKLEWTTLSPSPVDRDIIFDLGPHPIDILNFLLGEWPTVATCQAEAYRRERLEELAYFTLKFDQKLIAHVELSWLQPGKKREVTIIGSERAAIVDCLDQSVKIFENGDTNSFPLEIASNNTILDELKHFASSIATGKNGRNSGSLGARNVAVLESLKQSLKNKCTVKVDLQEPE